MVDHNQPTLTSSVPGKEGNDAPRALISVYDKTGVTALATALTAMGWQILSTGGTARLLRENGLEVIDVTDVTGHPEVFDGRVKTLHPAIHAAILARGDNPADMQTLSELGYPRIDLVAVNLYPFEEVAAQVPPVSESALIEMIDIGGPTLVRASAKAHSDVLVVTDPTDYSDLLETLQEANGDPTGVDISTRQRLALTAYQRTAAYDVALANILANRLESLADEAEATLPEKLLISGGNRVLLRYGENPHQPAAFYPNSVTEEEPTGLASAIQHGGKALSFNNYLDLDAALRFCRSFIGPEWEQWPHCCIIIKHTNACGVAISTKSQAEAWKDALASDPESAFGCVVAFNTPLNKETADTIGNHFVECIIAPGYDEGALEELSIKKNRRMLTMENMTPLDMEVHYREIDGGWLAQTEGAPIIDWKSVKCVSKAQANDILMDLSRFGVAICAQVKSNCVVFVKATETGFASVGIGPGQTSRVEAVRIAARRAGPRASGAVMVSDAFFPFRDGIDAAHEMGITTVVQPGGSIRDAEVIEAANEHGMAMIFTGTRLFRH